MSDLDDFFAKKDKKKIKTKKFATAEDLVKNLEDTSKRNVESVKLKVDKPITLPETEITNSEQIQEEEWKSFEEEKRKDYTGLKIGHLMTDGRESELLQNSDGIILDHMNISDYIQSEDGKFFDPWKKVVSTEQSVEPIENEKQETTQTKSLYVMPGLRAQGMHPLKSRKNRMAPDISNEEYFPTLGPVRLEEQKKKKSEPPFEEVGYSRRIVSVDDKSTAPINVENRFKSLALDDS